MQVFIDQLPGFFRQFIIVLLNNVFPDTAEWRIPIKIAAHFSWHQFAQLLQQHFIIFAEYFGIYKFCKVDFYRFGNIFCALFICLGLYSFQLYIWILE